MPSNPPTDDANHEFKRSLQKYFGFFILLGIMAIAYAALGKPGNPTIVYLAGSALILIGGYGFLATPKRVAKKN